MNAATSLRTGVLVLAAFFVAPCVQATPTSLFDGKSLAGWEGDTKWWRVEDGAITGGSRTETIPSNSYLATTKSYQNFDLKLRIKLTGSEGFINSGVQIRSVRTPDSSGVIGYQLDVGDGWWGKLYEESRRHRVLAEAVHPEAVNAAIHSDGWNEYRVRAEGSRVQSWINGVMAVDYVETEPNIPQDGYILIQLHGGAKSLVQVKDITILELPPTPGAPTWRSPGFK